jgi:hypothetical protein
MDTWSERTDHLAEHFKTGLTMGDWQGDWGFEDSVLKLVESAVPPCKSCADTNENYILILRLQTLLNMSEKVSFR